jgi:hypothetical protein
MILLLLSYLPLVGRSKRAALRVGGDSSARAIPHPKNASHFSTSPPGSAFGYAAAEDSPRHAVAKRRRQGGGKGFK